MAELGHTSAILNTFDKDFDERRIIKQSRLLIPLNLPQIKIPLAWIGIQTLRPSTQSHLELGNTNLAHVFTREDLLSKSLSPLVIAIGNCGVPSVQQVELKGNLVSHAFGGPVVRIDVGTCDTGVEVPGVICTIQTEDCADVIVEDDVDVQSAGDPIHKVIKVNSQSRRLCGGD